jgi:hypothetical protein
MRILYQNFLDSDSSWTAYSEDANYPLANLYDTRLSRQYRTNGVASTEYIQSGESSTVPQYVALINHNVSSSCTITFEGASSSGFSTLTYTKTLAWSSYAIISTITSTVACNYFRFRFVGLSTLTQNYISIGYAYAGTYLELPPMKNDQNIKDETTAKITISDGGQAYGDNGYSYVAPTINFPYITQTERTNIRTMWATVKNYIPVILIVWPNNTDVQKPIYCVIDSKTMDFKRTDDVNMPWSVSMQFREVF